MPLLLSKPINPYSAYAVWNIQETNQTLLGLLTEPHPEGLHLTRLSEWIIGRILVRSLCALFDLRYEGIESHETGKPFLKGLKAEISISHSFPMAAAMIHLNKPCGIDLERKRQKLVIIRHKFINEREHAYRNDLDKLCAIWCGKEVLYKIYGRKKLSLKDETTIKFESDSVLIGLIHKGQTEKQYRIHYEQVKDYFLAYSL